MTCKDLELLLVLYACDELDAGERAAVETHTRQCSSCANLLERELRLRQMVTAVEPVADRLDPSGLLLAQCRSEIAEALDDAGNRRELRGWLGIFRPAHWFAFRPALSAALLIFLGVALGSVVPRWVGQRNGRPALSPAMTISESPRLSEQDLESMDIAGINWVLDDDTGSSGVEVRLTTEKPVVVRGSVDDMDVKRVLTYVMLNSQRFDPGVRLDSMDVLRTSSSDDDVRRVLCAAARRDRNPAVRLKAIEALRGLEDHDTVRQALLDSLMNDSNPGVRIEAINALRALVEKAPSFDDPRVLNVLRERMEKDPNRYIRLQAAAAIRQLGPSELH